jgi:hypothetical protein
LALIPGTRVGVFEISRQIGEGGMGAVYGATDTSLSRQVAIKVLPDAFAVDADRLARFEREAKALAALNHPYIAAIYAIEISAGAIALVMELVEGDDLSQRIAQGAIPLDEALPITKQIAEALETAHEQSADLWVVPMVGEHPTVFLKAAFREAYGVFSPDGRWVAYQSNESGRTEVYVRPFVAPGAADQAAGGQWQVSTAGGIRPTWRPDGKALYYLNPAGAMMAAPVAVSGATFEPGSPVVLFPTRIFDGGVDTQNGRQYDVAPDGRFLINTELPGDAAPITLIQHWQPGS